MGDEPAGTSDGVLAIYELNDFTILREVFLRAYERSAQRYTVIRGGVGDPDPFRLKYRQAIVEQIAEIIRSRCARPEAVARLREWAENSVIESDRKRFLTAAEETLAGIHEGNFARYRVALPNLKPGKQCGTQPDTCHPESAHLFFQASNLMEFLQMVHARGSDPGHALEQARQEARLTRGVEVTYLQHP